MPSPFLSLIIPCYREAERLPSTIKSLLSWKETFPHSLEVILVIEPSPDETLDVARSLANTHEWMTVIENEQRLGKGGTVAHGMKQANGEWRAFCDADGATDFSFFTQVFSQTPLPSIIIASRAHPQSQLIPKQPFFRQLTGLLFRYATRLITHLPYPDTQCGCKVFHHTLVPILFEPLQEQGFAMDVELLLKARRLQEPVLELPCIWRDQPGSTVHPIQDGLRMLTTLIRLRKQLIRKERLALESQHLSSYE
ncbi:glycosyltransferase [Cytobacillus sp. FJAT-54145]|uniref:Glycosyltransferase n=1 Tax=Cytobacillus spartinae TaxID=3299023 RepID=A0ABW6KDD0_9BACI